MCLVTNFKTGLRIFSGQFGIFYFQDSRCSNGSLQVIEMFVGMYVYNTFWKKDLLNLTNFGAVYLTQFLTDFSQILDSKSYDQA